MKKRYLLLVMAVLAFISGCMQADTNDSAPRDNAPMDTQQPSDPQVTTPSETPSPTGGDSVYGVLNKDAIVDKNKYLIGGREMFDTAKVHFLQDVGKGFEVTVDAGEKIVKIEVMTDEQCVLLDDKQQYEVIDTKEGTMVAIEHNQPADEKTNICINIEAIDDGEITVHVTVNELTLTE